MTKAKSSKSAEEPATNGARDAKPKKGEAGSSQTSKKGESRSGKPAARKETQEKPAVRKASDTDVIEKAPKTAPAADAPPVSPASSRIGLGIKVSSRKPALSVAPSAMVLGRAAQTKADPPPRPSERRLSKKEQAEIKTFLLEKRERLLAAMRRELAIQKERATSKVADDVDKATDAYDEDLSFEIATANDQELEDIQIALEKIDKGTYGECELCGCAISPSRLKILPSATTCVACRGQEEQLRRRDDGQPLFSMMAGEDGEDGPEAL